MAWGRLARACCSGVGAQLGEGGEEEARRGVSSGQSSLSSGGACHNGARRFQSSGSRASGESLSPRVCVHSMLSPQFVAPPPPHNSDVGSAFIPTCSVAFTCSVTEGESCQTRKRRGSLDPVLSSPSAQGLSAASGFAPKPRQLVGVVLSNGGLWGQAFPEPWDLSSCPRRDHLLPF